MGRPYPYLRGESKLNRDRMVTVITFSSQRMNNSISPGRAVPRLLVSVRSLEEVAQAIRGGAHVVDVKEPARGSLGMAEIGVIREIAAFLRDEIPAPSNSANVPIDTDRPGDSPHETVPLSVALGELREWVGRRDVPALPDEVTFAKLGLSDTAGASEWQAEWQRLRHEFDRQRNVPLRWVAVAYADDAAARSVPLDEVFPAAATSGCAGLLIDTFAKQGQTLADFISVAKLAETVQRCHAAGMFLAIAGSLTIDSVQTFSDVNADIIAIRSAACRNANRCHAIDASRVAEFRAALSQAMGEETGSCRAF